MGKASMKLSIDEVLRSKNFLEYLRSLYIAQLYIPHARVVLSGRQ